MSSEPSMIRVIEVRRSLADPLSATQEELDLVVSAILEIPAFVDAGPGFAAGMKGMLYIAEFLQGSLAPFLAAGPQAWTPRPTRAPGAAQGDEGAEATQTALLLREVLAN